MTLCSLSAQLIKELDPWANIVRENGGYVHLNGTVIKAHQIELPRYLDFFLFDVHIFKIYNNSFTYYY